jgi:hypothetical protein
MPVEDIDFLKKNSIKENFLFLVDSKHRNKKTYPSPNEYVVEFETPFRNIIGLNLIDASIPRTMYNVDIYNNEIAFYIYTNTPPNSFTTVTLETGDYTIQTLIIELNKKLRMTVDGMNVGITASALSNPPDIKNRIQFKCPYKFAFDMEASTINETLGFDAYVRRQEGTEINYDMVENELQIFYSHAFAFNRDASYALYEGPKGVIRTLNLMEGSISQRFFVPYRTNIIQLNVALGDIGVATFGIQMDTTGVPSGMNIASGTVEASYTDGSYSDSIHLNCVLEGNRYYWIVFENTDTDLKIYYNDVLTTDNTLLAGDSILEGYELCMRVDVADDYNCIKAPGIYSLVGERYIVLRCKEIEENSYRSLSYTKNPMGIAKFTLGIVGYSEERLDYSSVPAREFHPIGKLSRLTLRFETQKGKLYDFKDVNHTLTFSIKYLEPSSKTEFTASIINSNYNGDFMKYQYSQEEQEEDSDDQEQDYNEDDFEKYKKNESHNLPWQVAQRNVQLYYDLNYGDEVINDEN